MANWMDVRGLAGAEEASSERLRHAPLELLAGLNQAQSAAVTGGDGALSILAGPGSGKARVVTHRIAWLALERGVRPEEILAITFTNKAAREMRARLDRLLPAAGAWMGTFHGTC